MAFNAHKASDRTQGKWVWLSMLAGKRTEMRAVSHPCLAYLTWVHLSGWTMLAPIQNPHCKGVWEIQCSLPSLCSIEGILEGSWSKCWMSIYCICYTSNNHRYENMLLKKIIYKLYTRTNSFFWTKNKCAFRNGQICNAVLFQQEIIGTEVDIKKRGMGIIYFLYPSNKGISKVQCTVSVYVVSRAG